MPNPSIFFIRSKLKTGLNETVFFILKATIHDITTAPANVPIIDPVTPRFNPATTYNEHTKYDIEFHSMLYKISGNETIQRFQKILLPLFEGTKGLYSILPEEMTEKNNYVFHRGLLNTLKEGTAAEFRNKMRNHLMQYFNKL